MRKIISVLVALCAWMVCLPAAAQTTTYAYAGNPYSTFTNFTACQAGPCANFTGAMNIAGSFQTSAPLAPNLVATDISGQITGFNFSDGLTVYGRADPQVRLNRADVTTNAAGDITGLDFTLTRWLTATPIGQCETPGACNVGPPLTVIIQPFTNPNTKVDLIQIRTSLVEAAASHNLTCVTRGVAPSGETGACLSNVSTDTGASRAGSTLALPIPAPALVAGVPTLSEWAMILFGVILAGGAAVMIHRKRFAA